MIKKRIADLLSVKSIITITLTAIMAVLLIGHLDPPKELLAVYCTSYGSVITYFFTKKEDHDDRGKED